MSRAGIGKGRTRRPAIGPWVINLGRIEDHGGARTADDQDPAVGEQRRRMGITAPHHARGRSPRIGCGIVDLGRWYRSPGDAVDATRHEHSAVAKKGGGLLAAGDSATTDRQPGIGDWAVDLALETYEQDSAVFEHNSDVAFVAIDHGWPGHPRTNRTIGRDGDRLDSKEDERERRGQKT